LVVVAVALVVVALVEASAVVVALVVAVVVMAPALAQSLALVVAVVAIAQAIISSLALVSPAPPIPAHLATHALLVEIVSLTHVLLVLVTHVLLVLPIHVLLALLTHVHLLAHVLLNQKLAVSVEVLAVTKYDSPSSSPFCMESSRFR
jgi:hypothetical protein